MFHCTLTKSTLDCSQAVILPIPSQLLASQSLESLSLWSYEPGNLILLLESLSSFDDVDDPEFPTEIPGRHLRSLEVVVDTADSLEHTRVDSRIASDDVQRILYGHHSSLEHGSDDDDGPIAEGRSEADGDPKLRTLLISSCLAESADLAFLAEEVKISPCRCHGYVARARLPLNVAPEPIPSDDNL